MELARASTHPAIPGSFLRRRFLRLDTFNLWDALLRMLPDDTLQFIIHRSAVNTALLQGRFRGPGPLRFGGAEINFGLGRKPVFKMRPMGKAAPHEIARLP